MPYECLGYLARFPFNGDIQASHVPIVPGRYVSSLVQQELENIKTIVLARYMKWCVVTRVFPFQRTW